MLLRTGRSTYYDLIAGRLEKLEQILEETGLDFVYVIDISQLAAETVFAFHKSVFKAAMDLSLQMTD